MTDIGAVDGHRAQTTAVKIRVRGRLEQLHDVRRFLNRCASQETRLQPIDLDQQNGEMIQTSIESVHLERDALSVR